ncbi:MAG: polysaccharide deacetylase family protein [Syntrophomonadaceae bacterium]
MVILPDLPPCSVINREVVKGSAMLVITNSRVEVSLLPWHKYFILTALIAALLGPQFMGIGEHSEADPTPVYQAASSPSGKNDEKPEPETNKPEPALIPLPSGQVGRIPVLMYHEISSGPDCMWVETSAFRAQMQYLNEQGIQTITLSQAAALLQGRYDTSKMVVLTFDDGYDTFYEYAWPILQEFNQTATVFVISGLVGNPGYMNWEQIKFLSLQGIEIGGHTLTHPLLPDIPAASAQKEIEQDKKNIEAQLGQVITSFCYPTGRYDSQIQRMLVEAEYKNAVTMVQREASTQDSLLLLPRWGVYQGDSLARFEKLVK